MKKPSTLVTVGMPMNLAMYTIAFLQYMIYDHHLYDFLTYAEVTVTRMAAVLSTIQTWKEDGGSVEHDSNVEDGAYGPSCPIVSSPATKIQYCFHCAETACAEKACAKKATYNVE